MASLKKPVDFDELYPGRFMKAGELGDRKCSFTIADVDIEELEGESGKKVKGVISFTETAKQFCLNKTNGICLREMFGRKVQGWIGKRISLFKGEWNGDDCIRIWGSKDIAADMPIVVQLPRKKPIKMLMHKIRDNGSGAKEVAPEDRGDAWEANEAERHLEGAES